MEATIALLVCAFLLAYTGHTIWVELINGKARPARISGATYALATIWLVFAGLLVTPHSLEIVPCFNNFSSFPTNEVYNVDLVIKAITYISYFVFLQLALGIFFLRKIESNTYLNSENWFAPFENKKTCFHLESFSRLIIATSFFVITFQISSAEVLSSNENPLENFFVGILSLITNETFQYQELQKTVNPNIECDGIHEIFSLESNSGQFINIADSSIKYFGLTFTVGVVAYGFMVVWLVVNIVAHWDNLKSSGSYIRIEFIILFLHILNAIIGIIICFICAWVFGFTAGYANSAFAASVMQPPELFGLDLLSLILIAQTLAWVAIVFLALRAGLSLGLLRKKSSGPPASGGDATSPTGADDQNGAGGQPAPAQ